MVYWPRSCTGVHGSMQQRLISLNDRAAHILYVGLQQQQEQSQSERRTHRDHLLFLLRDSTAAHNPNRRGCRSERPGRRTIRNRAVRGWSGYVGHPVLDLLPFSRSTPFPLLPLTLSAPSTTVKTAGIRTPHFRLLIFKIERLRTALVGENNA